MCNRLSDPSPHHTPICAHMPRTSVSNLRRNGSRRAKLGSPAPNRHQQPTHQHHHPKWWCVICPCRAALVIVPRIATSVAAPVARVPHQTPSSYSPKCIECAVGVSSLPGTRRTCTTSARALLWSWQCSTVAPCFLQCPLGPCYPASWTCGILHHQKTTQQPCWSYTRCAGDAVGPLPRDQTCAPH